MGIESASRSRRERPAKPALSRAGIVAAAIGIMQSEGLDKVTMRRVAEAVDTGPASLYVYVANTAELHGAILDGVLGTLDVPPSGTWQERLERLIGDYGRLLFQYPGLARSALVLPPAGPNVLRVADRLLGLLLEGGVEPARAAWGVDLLLLVATASAAEHSTPLPADLDAPMGRAGAWDAMSSAVRGIDPAIAPHVAAHAGTLLSGSPAQRDRWALRALIAGIAVTPIPTPTTENHLPEEQTP